MVASIIVRGKIRGKDFEIDACWMPSSASGYFSILRVLEFTFSSNVCQNSIFYPFGES